MHHSSIDLSRWISRRSLGISWRAAATKSWSAADAGWVPRVR